jgi:hypothetical protein
MPSFDDRAKLMREHPDFQGEMSDELEKKFRKMLNDRNREMIEHFLERDEMTPKLPERTYLVYVVRNNVRSDGCDYSLLEALPTKKTQEVVDVFRVTKLGYGDLPLGPGVLSQRDVVVDLLYTMFVQVKRVGP